MQLIEDKSKFDALFLEARTCVHIDSYRLPASLTKLIFDDAEICTTQFSGILQSLMEWSGDEGCHYLVLEPDPVYYFHRLFNKYPMVDIAKGESPDDYISKLNESPNGNPAESLGTHWWSCVIIPDSKRWFVHALRSDRADSGHLWVPEIWVDRVVEAYPCMSKTG